MKRIKDLKTRQGGIHGISHEASVAEAVRKFVEADVSCLAVYEDEKLVGVFTKNDLVRCCARCPERICDLKVADHMKHNPYVAQIDDDLDDIIEEMIKKGFRHVPVMENGRAVGMVTPIDILEHQRGLLRGENEELVRYIRGNY